MDQENLPLMENEPSLPDGSRRPTTKFHRDQSEDSDKIIQERVYKFDNNGEDGEGRDENLCSSLFIFCCPKL